MCLAIPTLITSVEGTRALAEIGGVERCISIALTPEACVGDHVLVHAGFAISVIDAQEAQETLQLLHELAELAGQETGGGRRRHEAPQDTQP